MVAFVIAINFMAACADFLNSRRNRSWRRAYTALGRNVWHLWHWCSGGSRSSSCNFPRQLRQNRHGSDSVASHRTREDQRKRLFAAGSRGSPATVAVPFLLNAVLQHMNPPLPLEALLLLRLLLPSTPTISLASLICTCMHTRMPLAFPTHTRTQSTRSGIDIKSIPLKTATISMLHFEQQPALPLRQSGKPFMAHAHQACSCFVRPQAFVFARPSSIH